jgi:hypothetical protein
VAKMNCGGPQRDLARYLHRKLGCEAKFGGYDGSGHLTLHLSKGEKRAEIRISGTWNDDIATFQKIQRRARRVLGESE